MDKVPVMISTKDLSYISDMINWNLVASKKANHYKNEVIDPEVKELMNKVALMHADHYNKLLNLLG